MTHHIDEASEAWGAVAEALRALTLDDLALPPHTPIELTADTEPDGISNSRPHATLDEAITTAFDACDDELDAIRECLALCDAVVAAVDDLTTVATEGHASLAPALADASAKLDDLETTMAHVGSSTREAHDDAEADVHAMIDRVEESETDHLLSVTEEATREVRADVREAISNTITKIEADATADFAAIGRSVSDHGANLEQLVDRSVTASAQRILDHTAEEVSDAFGEVVREGIEMMVTEIASHAAIAAASTPISASLAPIVPALVAAKAALHAANSLLDIVGIRGH